MSVWSSRGVGGRPGRDFQRHNNRNPARCHRISVRGPTTTSASRQSNHRESTANEMRSAALANRSATATVANSLASPRIEVAFLDQVPVLGGSPEPRQEQFAQSTELTRQTIIDSLQQLLLAENLPFPLLAIDLH